MSPSDDIVNQATAKLDDNLEPLEGADNAADDKSTEEPAPDAPDKSPPESDDAASDGERGDDKDDADEGYTIDEDDEEDEPEAAPEREAAKPAETGRLNAEQQYIWDRLPELVTYGHAGDGKMQEYRVKVDSELPRGFEFASKNDELAFIRNLSAQEYNARQLQNEYQTSQNAQAAEKFKEQEDTADRSDIATLQKAGDLAKFKVKVDDPKFDADPAAKLITDVLAFKEERNQQYLEQYNHGRPYRHIGFEEAFYMFRRNNPERTRPPAEQAEDKQRKQVAKNVGSGGLAPQSLTKARVKPGISTRDLLARIDTLDF